MKFTEVLTPLRQQCVDAALVLSLLSLYELLTSGFGKFIPFILLCHQTTESLSSCSQNPLNSVWQTHCVFHLTLSLPSLQKTSGDSLEWPSGSWSSPWPRPKVGAQSWWFQTSSSSPNWGFRNQLFTFDLTRRINYVTLFTQYVYTVF